MSVLVIVHVFYPEMWPELRACVQNIPEAQDIVVTYVDEASVVEVRRDLPRARFLRCANRGFDVWPFLAALHTVDLCAYDLVVKLHTKRDIAFACRFNGCDFGGPNWRETLLSFCRTPEAWRRACARFDDACVGMVAARDVIVRRKDVSRADARAAFDRAVEEMKRLGWRFSRSKSLQFVAGTMFAVRTEVLRQLLTRNFSESDFVPSAHVIQEDMEYAHVIERLLGFAVTASGFRLAAHDGSLIVRRLEKRVRKIFEISCHRPVTDA